MKQLFLSLFLLIAFTSWSQSPTISWQKTYGGSDNEFGACTLTKDHGFIFNGSAYSYNGDVTGMHGFVDAWLIKTDSAGNIQWKKAYGGSMLEIGAYAYEDAQGNFYFTGQSNSNDGDVTVNKGAFDVWVVKVDSAGHILWQHSYGGTMDDIGRDLVQTHDGGYAVCATTSSPNNGDVTNLHGGDDFWILRLDTSGNLLWRKCYGGSNYETPYAIHELPDHGFVVFGETQSTNMNVTGNHGGIDYWLVRLDSSGTLLWQKTYGGSGSDQGRDVLPTPDGGFMISGFSASNDGDVNSNHGSGTSDFWILKVDSVGSIVWERSYGGSADEFAQRIHPASSGGYFIAGTTQSCDQDVSQCLGLQDFWVIRIDANGNLDWEKTMGGTSWEQAVSAQETPDGGLIISGGTNSTDGDVTLNHGASDYWLVKLDGINSINEDPRTISLEASNNPSDGIFTIHSSVILENPRVVNSLGQIVWGANVSGNSFQIDLRQQSSGVFYLMVNGISKKLVKL